MLSQKIAWSSASDFASAAVQLRFLPGGLLDEMEAVAASMAASTSCLQQHQRRTLLTAVASEPPPPPDVRTLSRLAFASASLNRRDHRLLSAAACAAIASPQSLAPHRLCELVWALSVCWPWDLLAVANGSPDYGVASQGGRGGTQAAGKGRDEESRGKAQSTVLTLFRCSLLLCRV